MNYFYKESRFKNFFYLICFFFLFVFFSCVCVCVCRGGVTRVAEC